MFTRHLSTTSRSRRRAALVLLVALAGLASAVASTPAAAGAAKAAKVTTTTAATPTTAKPPKKTTSTTTTSTTTTSTTTTSTTTTSTTTTTVAPAPEPDAVERTTLVGVRAPGTYDPYDMATMTAWQGKTNAVAVTFRKTNVSVVDLVAKLALIWREGSVPMLTIEPLQTPLAIASGLTDVQIDAWATGIKTWLAGPDLVYGNGDDRRVFIRLAHEANGSWYPWSPCSATGGTPADYRAMWHRYHDRFASTGVDATRLQWVFSMNQTDTSSACLPEDLYPGDAYVDWLGLDGYSRSSGKTVDQELAPMTNRLRAIAPGKPFSINEWGVSQHVTKNKSQWIADYFAWVHDHDVRMITYFNIDTSTREWGVFGGVAGDEVYVDGLRSFNAWSAYRQGIASSWAVGSDTANPRLLTDAQFAGD